MVQHNFLQHSAGYLLPGSSHTQSFSLAKVFVLLDLPRSLYHLVTGLALVALMIARHTLATTTGQFCKNKISYSRVLRGIGCTRYHIVKSRVEREHRHGVLPLLESKEQGARGFSSSLFIV